MAINITEIKSDPALPATIRDEQKFDPQAVSAQMEFLRDVHKVAVANLTQKPQTEAGKATHALTQSYVDSCGAGDQTVLNAARDIIKDMVNITNNRACAVPTGRGGR